MMRKMKPKLILLAIGALFALGAVETPQAWPMGNGDTCYTYFASLSCTSAAQAVVTPTGNPVLTATPTAATLPKAWQEWACWQYTNAGSESGITGLVDRNRWAAE